MIHRNLYLISKYYIKVVDQSMKLEMKVKKDVIENPDLGDIKVKRKFLIFPKIYEFDDKRIWCWLRNVYEKY